MREWVAKKIKAYDVNADWSFGFQRAEGYDARVEMSSIDTMAMPGRMSTNW